jgi:hypothetical protein
MNSRYLLLLGTTLALLGSSGAFAQAIDGVDPSGVDPTTLNAADAPSVGDGSADAPAYFPFPSPDLVLNAAPPQKPKPGKKPGKKRPGAGGGAGGAGDSGAGPIVQQCNITCTLVPGQKNASGTLLYYCQASFDSGDGSVTYEPINASLPAGVAVMCQEAQTAGKKNGNISVCTYSFDGLAPIPCDLPNG